MRQLNIPSTRAYFISRIVFLIACVAVLTFVVTQNGFTSRASNFAFQGGCTTDPVVANSLDAGAGSLRQAIADACAGSTITFNMASVTSPITLTTAELAINKDLTITGPGAAALTIERSSAQATPHFRIFNVTSGTVSISGLTLTNGRAPDGVPTAGFGTQGGSGGGIRSSATSLTLSDVHLINNRAGNGTASATIPGEGGEGGAVYSEFGSLSMANSTITGNSGGNGGFNGFGIGGANGGSGGGIYKENGALTLTNVTITNNTAGNSSEPNATAGHGGGIYTNTNVTTTLTNCSVSNNSAGDALGTNGLPGFGGGINNDGLMTVISSTISGNTSDSSGGGFLSRVLLTVINSTISGNSAPTGGGINNDVPSLLSLTNSTITNNTALGGAGILNFNPNASARNTIIAGNVGQDASGTFVSLGNNIIGISTTGFVNGVNGDKVGTQESPLNAGLAPLANNGGPTQTHALLATSPALDAGNNCVLNNSCFPGIGVPLTLTTDQRGAGFPRAADSADADGTQTVDIGAFEGRASVENITDKSTPEDTLLSFSFNVGDASAITNVSASSANTVLVPNANVSVFGSGSTRTLNITPAPDLSGTSTITVTVTSDTESMSDTFVLTVTPVNDAPVDIALSNNNVADNSPSNTPIGTFSSTDPDPLQTFTYSLVSGVGSLDNASFSIVGDQLRTASTIDFETKSVFTIRVRSTDGGSLFVEKQFLISVIDGPDNPGAISFTSGNFNVGEGDGNANITLIRTGGTDNRVVAKVNLADVTTSPADYVFAPGSLDPSFNTGTGATSGSSALQQFVDTLVLQPDGKILIGGAFLFYNDVTRNRVARINSDGTLDTSFNPGSGPNTPVLCMALQPDGKILIGGNFITYDGTSRARIARLNTDGTLDQTFAAVPDDVVRSIVVQPDGKILIGGDFFNVNGNTRNRVARLNSDGSLDFSFNAVSGSNGAVSTLALQPDGKIVVGGGFLSFGGVNNTRIVRLTSTGALDATFNPVLGTSLAPRQVLLQPDGKILVAGEFIGIDTPFGKQGIARLETSGAADPTFNPGLGTDGHTIEAMALQPDSKIVIVGWFPTFNGTTVNRVARLNSGGSVDSSFNSGDGANSPAFSVALQPDGEILVGGLFTFYNNVSANGIMRLNGDLFATWEAGDSANKSVRLPIVDDSLDEPNETLSLQIVPVSGGATGGVPSSATLTIVDNDSSPTAISAVSGAGTFGGTATLTATLTTGGSVLSGKTVSFTVNGSGVGNATTNASGVATLSGVSISGVNAGTHPDAVGASFAAEPGNFSASSGTGPLTVNQAATATAVSSSVNPSEFGQSVTFTATVASSGGTPTGTVQFKDGNSNLGSPQTLTAGVAQLSTSSLASGTHTITAEYSGDTNFIASSGTLAGGQVVKPQPTLTINDVSIAEGHGGTTNLVFTVTLSAASTLTVNVDFATADGTASTSDSDYQSANGTLTFNPGDLSKTITVVVNGDLKTELNETVFVNLNNPVNVAVTDAQGTGTITNDDTLLLILDESGPAADQAAALESMLLLRDPFKVLSVADWLNFGPDRNTRVIVFAANLQGNLAVIPSVIVTLVDGNNQTHDVPAEDVRPATHPDFSQVVFRLPNSLAPGVCRVTIKSQERTSNTGTIRIAQ
ncbi:MAG TPA: Ig-like domain repeat protein [Pyrinomonadaceae bacterium]|nr:Ig-like domain repeat protein [Pyrinomonadaceae bacterium]